MKREKKQDKYEKEILKLFDGLNRYVTAADVSQYLGFSSKTVRKRLIRLAAKGQIRYKKEGDRIYFTGKN
jgi:Mn-dependent DtxR family transcriptional regulator